MFMGLFDEHDRKKLSDRRQYRKSQEDLQNEEDHEFEDAIAKAIVFVALLPIYLPGKMLGTLIDFDWENEEAVSRLKRVAFNSTIVALVLIFIVLADGTTFKKADDFQAYVVFPLLAILYANSLFIVWSFRGKEESQIAIAEAFVRIGLIDKEGHAPRLIKQTPTELTFMAEGIPRKVFFENRDYISSILNVRIKEVLQGNSYQEIILRYSRNIIPSRIEFEQFISNCLNAEPESVLVGHDGDDVIFRTLSSCVQILFNGANASGKSCGARVAVASLLLSSLQEGDIEIYTSDHKGGIEAKIYEPWLSAPVAMNAISTGAIIDYALFLLDQRMKDFNREGVVNIESWRKKIGRLPRILIIFEEAADSWAELGRWDKENKSDYKYIDKIESLARRARAFGIHLLVITQYGEQAIIPSQIKQNLCSRWVYRLSSDQASINLVGDSSAYNLSPIPGRLIFSIGGDKNIELQTPYLSEERCVEILRQYVPEVPISEAFIAFLKDTGREDLAASYLTESSKALTQFNV